MNDLERMIREKQDLLRGRRLTQWERFVENLPPTDIIDEWIMHGATAVLWLSCFGIVGATLYMLSLVK